MANNPKKPPLTAQKQIKTLQAEIKQLNLKLSMSHEALRHSSHHDPITHLPNWAHFENQLSKIMAQSLDNQQIALLYLNLDNFKIINNGLGRNIGDQVLRAVSAILQKNVGSNSLVARLGSDEFAIILRDIKKQDDVLAVANAVLEALKHPIILLDKEIYANTSIGIALHPFPNATATQFIKNASAAMAAAKKNGKNQCCIFTATLNEERDEKLQIYSELRTAPQKNELFLEYQPIINLATLQCSCVETLVRWQHPTLGTIYPAHFLPYAEETGQMPAIGQWVIKHALEDYNKCDANNLCISINISANELNNSQAENTILHCMQKNGIPHNKLILEITETEIMKNPEVSIKKFWQLVKIGIRISIDDYGSGYSALKYLKNLPISFLKIDKSFIADINKSTNSSNIIIKSTIELAHGLNLKVVAEGIETEEQLAFLKKHNSDYGQGFYFAPSLKIDALKKFLLKQNKAR